MDVAAIFAIMTIGVVAIAIMIIIIMIIIVTIHDHHCHHHPQRRIRTSHFPAHSEYDLPRQIVMECFEAARVPLSNENLCTLVEALDFDGTNEVKYAVSSKTLRG